MGTRKFEKWNAQRVESEWFFNFDGEQLTKWDTAWKAALRRAGIKKGAVLFYDARKTARTKMDDNDVSTADAKLVMGHKTDSLSTRYNQSKKGIRRVARKMAKTIVVVPAIAPGAAIDDDVTDLQLVKLKRRFDAGLIPESI